MRSMSRKVFARATIVAVGVFCIGAAIVIVRGNRNSEDSSSKTWYLHTGALPVSVPCFRLPRTYKTGASGSDTLVVVDFNGDGCPDLAALDPQGDSVSVLTNSGRGAFEQPRAFPAGKRPYSLAAADLNGDLSPDLVTANANSGTVSVLLNTGAGSFPARTDYGVGQAPGLVTTGDIDGDGSADIVVANQAGPTRNSVLLNRGDGTFRTGSPLSIGRIGAFANVNDDGMLDLVSLNKRSVSVLLNLGRGRFAAAVHYRTGDGPISAAVGDLNGDGAPDLVTANYGIEPMGVGYTVSVLLNKGDGTFGRKHDFMTAEYPTSVAIGDVTSDGEPDIVSTDAETENVSVLVNDGHTRFEDRLIYPQMEKPGGAASVSVADLNGDGEADLVRNDWATVAVLINVPGPCHDTGYVQ